MTIATPAEVQDRLDWTLNADEQRMAEKALEDASDLARSYGNPRWDDGIPAPRLVRTLVLRSVVRFMRNTDGLTVSRAGDETMQWAEGGAGQGVGAPYFTSEEIELLASLAGRAPTLTSVPMVAWGSTPIPPTGYVPVNYGPPSDPFPFFAEGYR